MESYVKAIRKAMSEGYVFFGIRTGKDKKVGQYCALSHEYNWDGNRTDEVLNGTCTTGFDVNEFEDDEDISDAIEEYLKLNTETYKQNANKNNMQYIVAGKDMSVGVDQEHEWVINNSKLFRHRRGARVIAIIK